MTAKAFGKWWNRYWPVHAKPADSVSEYRLAKKAYQAGFRAGRRKK